MNMEENAEQRVAVVIEDDDDIRHLLETVLTQAGFRVVATSNGADGVEAVRANDPVVTTLDVNMPGMDGFETARRIRSFSATYIVMLTALNEEIDTLQGLEAGADDYVNKPFRPRELRARIEAMLRRPRLGFAEDGTPLTNEAPRAVPEVPEVTEQAPQPQQPQPQQPQPQAPQQPYQPQAPQYQQPPQQPFYVPGGQPQYQQMPPPQQPPVYQQPYAPPPGYQQPQYQPQQQPPQQPPVYQQPAQPQEQQQPVYEQPQQQPPALPEPHPVAPAEVAAPIVPAGIGGGWLEHNKLWLNIETRVVKMDDVELDLTRSEFDLLAALLESNRRVRTKADLVLLLRGESYVTSHFISEADKRAIEVHMGNLRKKLGDNIGNPRWIETVRGVGYRLTASGGVS